MKLVLDESGNTGCVTTHNGTLNFGTQSNFSLCGVLLPLEKDEKNIENRYQAFLERNKISDEIKGSDLMTRKNNAILFDFVNELLDSTHFRFNIYNKRFYLASLICHGVRGLEFRNQYPLDFYQLVSELSYERDDFFVQYCTFSRCVTPSSLRQYLSNIKVYPFSHLSSQGREILLGMVESMLEKDDAIEACAPDFLTFGSYNDKRKVNVIHLTALGEMLDVLKDSDPTITNKRLTIIHHQTKEFEDTLRSELASYGISISFDGSKGNPLIQIADNAVSIVNKVYTRMRNAFQNKKEWDGESRWDMELAALVFNKIGPNNIKFTMPIPDEAVALCVKCMFASSFPRSQRNNLCFNQLYVQYQKQIFNEIRAASTRHFEDSLRCLKR